ncbi:OPT super [Malassezia psittaci]|uniref:OPT super n=1 Tax=Malassezia psittaci TaxID=1821823 RepID=A0AAF0JCH8_9BASI|nr:OPT super [Malassezia psittaci]
MNSAAPNAGNVSAMRRRHTSFFDDEMTPRAIAMGVVVGALITFTNLYLGLQSGWISTMTLQGSLLGYALFQLIPQSVQIGSKRFQILARPLTLKENVIIQTVASAIGSLPLVSGAIGVLPALGMLDEKQDGVGIWLWTFGVAFAGIFFASPLREPMLLQERLPFPSGSATAQLVSLLHRTPLKRPPTAATHESTEEDNEAVALPETSSQQDVNTSWFVLIISLGVSCSVTLVSFVLPVLYALPLFDLVAPKGCSLTRWGWWFTPSFSYIGQGMIMGLSTSFHMVLGAIVGWAILSPLAHAMNWTTGEPLDAEDGGRGWMLWVSLAVMCSESVISILALIMSSSGKDFVNWGRGIERRIALNTSVNEALLPPGNPSHPPDNPSTDDADARSDITEVEEDDEPPERKTSMNWVVGGLIVSSIVGVAAVAGAVGPVIPAWATLLAFILASLFSVLAVRALGETDLNPVSGVAKISQLLYGVLQPGNVVANLVAGAITESGAMQAGELMQDYKTGYMVGVSPWNQFRGQLLGSFLGIGFTVMGYTMYRSTYTIPGPEFPAPISAIWINLARLINNGSLPEAVPSFMIFFGVVFGVSGLLHAIARSRDLRRKRSRRNRRQPPPLWEQCALAFPSGIAFATGMMNTPNFSIARLIGGLSAAVISRSIRRNRHSPEKGIMLVIVIASGFVLGEGFASMAGLAMKNTNLPVLCYGCRYGCGGGC